MSNKNKNKLTFIYWFTYYNLDSPSVRYRADYPLKFLKKNYNIGYELIIPSYRLTNILKFIRVYFTALLFPKRHSFVVIQRVHSNWIYSNLLKFLVVMRKNKTIYDIDDADYIDYPEKNIYYFMRNCSTVSVGSHELEKFVLKRNKSVLLNTSPTVDLNIIKKRKNDILNIGWIGCFGGGHKISLTQYFFPSLNDLPFNVKLTLMGVATTKEKEWLLNYFKDFNKVQLEIPSNINWLDETEVQERISNFDIGIATLLNDELHLSKSAFKLKQYFNNGVPALSSDILENNLFIQENINGFFCSNSDDFRRKIIQMNELPESEYKSLIKGSRNSICNFNLQTYCENLINHYDKYVN